MTTHPAENLSEKRSAWSPLGQHLFRSLWIAAVASNIGTWVEDVGEALQAIIPELVTRATCPQL